MRRVRTLVAGTALGFAALTLSVPAAYADSGSSAAESGKSWSSGSDSGSGEWHKSEGKGRPHGGPHAGIGFLDDGAGLATGAVLIAGGLGLGAYALRRRPVTGGATA